MTISCKTSRSGASPYRRWPSRTRITSTSSACAAAAYRLSAVTAGSSRSARTTARPRTEQGSTAGRKHGYPSRRLQKWIAEKAGIGGAKAGSAFTDALEDYQLRRINETIDYARRSSAFLSPPSRLALPLRPRHSIRDRPGPVYYAVGYRGLPVFLPCRTAGRHSPIVTLRTSGSTGEAKRLFFTEEDLELTVDFFHNGMGTMVRPGKSSGPPAGREAGQRGGPPRAGACGGWTRRPYLRPCVGPAPGAAREIASFGAHCLVGIPTQVLAVALRKRGPQSGKGP